MAGARADQRGELLAIYLNDHLTGATAGGAMFQRAANSANGELKAALQRLTAEVMQDRQSEPRSSPGSNAPTTDAAAKQCTAD